MRLLLVTLAAVGINMALSEAPHLRSNWARAAYAKMKHQAQHENSTHPEWYYVDRSQLIPDLNDTFVASHQDEATSAFLKASFDKSDWIFTQIYHSMAKSLLTWFMTQTSANGLLYRGSMFVVSKTQFRNLLGLQPEEKLDTLLDLGAGDGNTTAEIASLFREVHATEISPVMRWRLRQHGFKIVDVDGWSQSDVRYDVIACLNLLDRCDRPLTLLKEIRASLKPETGRLVLALVIPFRQYVEVTNDHKATEAMLIEPGPFEMQISQLLQSVLRPAGFEVERWTRVPYLCEGDSARAFYHLSDVFLVLKPAAPQSQHHSAEL